MTSLEMLMIVWTLLGSCVIDKYTMSSFFIRDFIVRTPRIR